MARKKRIGKKVKPVYFVFCEGKTEEEYVKFLKQYYRIPIEISCRVRNNISDQYIAKYKKGKPTHRKDKTFAMYDLDKVDTKDKILKLKAELLCSNPCIELWFLWHFKNQSAKLTTKNALDFFEKKYPNYKKGKVDIILYEKLLEKKDSALIRAKKFPKSENPSSHIYKLIELLESQNR